MNYCSRCGGTKKIESHHIIFKSRGGSDEDYNRKSLCKSCHDFIHAEVNLIEYLDYVRKNPEYYTKKLNKMKVTDKYYQSVKKSIKYYEDRIRLTEHRLEVLRKLNTIENIKKHGYRSYWIDTTTRS